MGNWSPTPEELAEAGTWPLLITLLLLDREEMYNHAISWRNQMARRTFTIEVKAELENDDPRYEACRLLVAKASHELLSSLMLLVSDKKPPEAVMFTEDAFFTTEEIKYTPEELEAALEKLASGEMPTLPEATTEGNPEDKGDGLDV